MGARNSELHVSFESYLGKTIQEAMSLAGVGACDIARACGISDATVRRIFDVDYSGSTFGARRPVYYAMIFGFLKEKGVEIDLVSEYNSFLQQQVSSQEAETVSLDDLVDLVQDLRRKVAKLGGWEPPSDHIWTE